MVILIMFGALTYFDVLNPEKYIKEECLFGTNIICEDWSITKVSENTFDINLKLRNDLEKPIEPVNILIYDRDSNQIQNCNFAVYCPYDSISKNWTAGSNGVFSPVGDDPRWRNGRNCRLEAKDCKKALISNTKQTFKISLEFKRAGGTAIHVLNAKLFAEASS